MSGNQSMKVGMASVAALAAGTGAVAAQDWTGPYAGISLDSTTGTSPIQPYVYDEGYTANNAFAGGAFAGLRWNAGSNLVMGVELAVQTSISLDPPSGYTSDPYSLNGLTDLKLSVGAPMGKALVYGFAGVSSASLDNSSDTYAGGSGFNVGIGFDYMINDKYSVGAEYISRNMSGYSSGGNPDSSKPLDTISLRASFHF